MHQKNPHPANLVPRWSILALVPEATSAALARIAPGASAIGEAFDRAYGKGKWFLYWDEDLAGRPIRGTIGLAHGKDTLVVG